MRPYAGRFTAGIALASVGSLLDAATVVLLVPLLTNLFGSAGAFAPGGTSLEHLLARVLGPIVAGQSHATITRRLVLLFLAVVAVKNILLYASAYLSVLVQEGMVRDLRVRLYRHLLRLGLDVMQRVRGGQLAAALVSDADQVKLVVVTVLAALAQNIVMVAATLIFMMNISVRLTMLVLALAPVLVLGVRTLVKHLKRHAAMFAHERGEVTAMITERVAAVKLIRASGAEAEEDRAFRQQADRYRKGIVRTQRFALLTSPVSEVFGAAMVVLILFAAANPAVSHVQMTGAVTFIFLALALRVMSPLKVLTQTPAMLAQAEASAARIFTLLDIPPSDIDPPGVRPATFQRELRFDHVTYGYEPDRPVLHDVSLVARKGEMVAIVGPSGAGKTTLLELVPRFYDPQRGSLSLDGVPLAELSRASVRNLIAVVSQDTIILHDTVHANIAYGRPDATADAVRAAAMAANAHQFIITLPARYDTRLGERGTRLSGGQRQRIAIARALLRDAPILILDEATSSLDTESERLVQEAIDRLMEHRTVLVIAHRLTTVRDADRIIVLDDGRVAETGTHAELLAQSGLYRRLHDLQFSMDEVTT